MRKIAALLCLLFALIGTRSALAADRYYVPPSQFNAAFQVMDMGFSNILGLFRQATAGFMFDAEAKTISNLKLAIDVGSLTTPAPDAARDLVSLFAAYQNPEIVFMAAAPATFKDGKAEIKGTLTVHGVSKPATFEGTLNQVGNSARAAGFFSKEGAAVGLSLRGSFKRTDFNMGDPPEMPGRFGESINMMLEMQALKQ